MSTNILNFKLPSAIIADKSKIFFIKYDSGNKLSFVQAFSVVLIDFVTLDACSICRTVDIDVI